ncbi:thioredoxin domain-containing protein [Pollutibacter soli]|uniref:thioredoxin domain-containing protein n=1 Tax=Pollutibacter soli TaxID=3034157 RepID=UPI003013D8C4
MAEANHLIKETSPYLLQHAHNPVDWYPWNREALDKAVAEDKPILVSIGYSACHWCHVMERESFEDAGVAEIMNRDFVNIKIDREERPDLDHIYMDALQAMTGSGGWPLNIFLTPDRKPFYGGTYFPPRPVHNRPSWKDVLKGVSQAYRERRAEVEAQAIQMIDHLENANHIGIGADLLKNLKGKKLVEKSQLREMRDALMQTADKTWGGFGYAPKFPQTFMVRFLMIYDFLFGDKEGLNHAILTLKKMMRGGIYDHIGGGFARYSTDTEWLVPHFEKMTYDNALISIAIADAYKVTGEQDFADVLDETLHFMTSEMMSEEFGFYAALDADSEGVEGKYYVWTRAEFDSVVGEDSALLAKYFDITEAGNWENENIPFKKQADDAFASKHAISKEELKQKVATARARLLTERQKRVVPGLDDKCLLGWNALMNVALTNAFAATGNRKWLDTAEKNMAFIFERFRNQATGEWYHTFKKGQAKYPAFLDDLAYLIYAMIRLSEVNGNTELLKDAEELTSKVFEDFADSESPLFYYTGRNQSDVVLRKKDWYDGSVPSGNAIMSDNFLRLGKLMDRQEWVEKSEQMLISLHEMILRYPSSFGFWAGLLLEHFAGTMEILILGEQSKVASERLLKTFIPNRIFQFSNAPEMGNPLHDGKPTAKETYLYLCRDYSCLKPVTDPEEFLQLVEKEKLT